METKGPELKLNLVVQGQVTAAVGGVPLLDGHGADESATLAVNFLRCGCAGVQCLVHESETSRFWDVLRSFQLYDENFLCHDDRPMGGPGPYRVIHLVRMISNPDEE